MFTLLTQRAVSRLGLSSAIRGITRAPFATEPNVISFQTRRAFLTGTPCLSFPTVAGGEEKAVAKSTAKGAAKKTGTGVKKAATPKAKAAKKKPVAKKPAKSTRPKLTKADLPPRRPGGVFSLFLTTYLKGLSPEEKAVYKDAPSIVRKVAVMWNELSDAEKQRYKDEIEAANAAYPVKRQAYFDSVPNKTLLEINKRRKESGKKRLVRHAKVGDRKPLSSYFRYVMELRESSDGQAVLKRASNGRDGCVQLARLGGQRWKALSDAEKAPYIEEAKKELAAWKAAKVQA